MHGKSCDGFDRAEQGHGALASLDRQQGYRELGGEISDQRQLEAQRRQLIRKLEALGVTVTVVEPQEAA